MEISDLLVNPDGKLLEEIEQKLFKARKSRALWAKEVEAPMEIETLEGKITAQPGDYVCRGIVGEYWAQKAKKLLETYDPTDDRDDDGWQRFAPKPDAPLVEATQVEAPFRVIARWGELQGNAGDYVVRSTTDRTDIWIVGKAIFEASYDRT